MQIIQKLLADERERLVRQILDDLPVHGGIVAIIGELCMGKTIVLESLRNAFHGNKSHPMPLIYVSMKDVKLEEDFYAEVLDQLRAFPLELFAGIVASDPWEILVKTVDKMSARLMSLTIIMDDVDVLAEREWGAKLFRRLAAFLDQDSRVHFIISGTHRLQDWAQRMPGKKGLWEYLLRPPVMLGALHHEKIQKILKPEVAQRLIKLCGGHPFLLARLGETIADGQSLSNQLAALDGADARFWQEDEGSDTFLIYWESYSVMSRQLCYLLAMNPLGYPRKDLQKILLSEGGSDQELTDAIRGLELTGVILQDDSGWLQLIDIFRTWYQNTIGYVQVTRPSPNWSVSQAATASDKPLTELIFLPGEKSVLVKRGHFFFQSELGVEPKFLPLFVERSDRVPHDDSKEALYRLNELTQNLWMTFSKTEWLKYVGSSSENGLPIRFYLPPELMGFPFEMLPVDDSGTRRIGTEVPISRHLLGQGRSIERAPLALPLQGDRGLKILSILAEIPKSWLDRYGFVRDGQPDETDAPVLNSISLKDEASELYRSFNNFSANIEEITFLSSRPVQGPAIKWAQPTAAALKTALREQQFDLIHFAGHVIFSSDSSIKQGVILQDEMVTLGALSKLLEEQKNLRFAYLSGCESGRMITNTFSSNLLGVAQTCIEAGVPAILSMRWPIPSGVSRRLTEEFYPAFFESGSLEQAALKAIKSLHDDQAVFSAAPILLMH